jgi:methionyl-tRNA synthetase
MIPLIPGMEQSVVPWPVLVAILIWTAIWKGIGLWRAGNHKQLAWFVVMFIFNTAGILPIIYLVWFQPKTRTAKRKKKR